LARALSLEEFQQILIEIAQAGKQRNLPRILFDAFTINGNIPTMQAHRYGEAIAELLPGSFRIAILVNEMNPSRQHVETVAINRGRYVKFFTEHDQASAWLFNSGV
jgi:hypothetical protein